MDTETQRQKNDTTNRYHRIKNNKSKTERGQDRHLDSRGEGERERQSLRQRNTQREKQNPQFPMPFSKRGSFKEI